MYQPTPQDFANVNAWQQKVFNQLQSGPSIPTPPDGPLVSAQASTLQPLPAGVAFDPDIGLGTVRFAMDIGIKDPAKVSKPYFFIGALKSLQPGSVEYAHVAYNCQTEQFEEQLGWLMQPGKKFPVLPVSILTGLPSFDTAAAENITPTVQPIPAEYDTVAKAVEFINDPVAARAKYGPK